MSSIIRYRVHDVARARRRGRTGSTITAHLIPTAHPGFEARLLLFRAAFLGVCTPRGAAAAVGLAAPHGATFRR